MKRIGRELRAWARRHSYSFFSSLGALLQHRVGTLMTAGVLGVALLLPLGLHVALKNISLVELDPEEWGAVTVFLQPSVDDRSAAGLAGELERRTDVESVRGISPAEGLREFRETSGFGASLIALEDNPLPWVLVVTPASEGEALPDPDALVDAIEGMGGVDFARYDRKWLERLGRFVDLGRALALVLGILFSLAVAVVVANTIRLDVGARTEEIEVLALVGAGNSFIRLPFLYAGLWYGLMGGTLAILLLAGASLWLSGPLDRLLASYGSEFDPAGLSAPTVITVLLGSGVLGWAGAFAAVNRHLRTLRIGGTLGRR